MELERETAYLWTLIVFPTIDQYFGSILFSSFW